MKKRVLALLLCVCLVALMVPPLPAQAATAADALRGVTYHGDPDNCKLTAQQAERYADIIDGEIASLNKYYEEYKGSDYFFSDGHMQFGAALVDDGSGFPLMIFVGGFDYFGASLVSGGLSWSDLGSNGVWYCDNGQVAKLENDGMYRYDIYQNYIFAQIGGSGGASDYCVYQAANGRLPNQPSIHMTWSGPDADWMETADRWYIDGQEISKAEAYAWVEKWDQGNALAGHSYGGGVEGWAYGVGSAEQLSAGLRAYADTLRFQSMSPAEILAEMAYVGDRGACRMTAQQAETYADVLETELKNTQDEWQNYGADYLNVYPYAVLFDTGAGFPAMLFNPVPFDNFADYCGVWEYLDGQALKVIRLPADRVIDIFRDHLFYTARGAIGTHSHAFVFQNGHINPQAVSETGMALGEDDFYETIDDVNATDEELKAWYKKWDGEDYLYRAWSDVWIGTQNIGAPNARTLISLLRAYANARRYPSYSYGVVEATESEYGEVLAAAGVAQAVEVHRLADGLYYVIYENGDSFSGALVRQVREKGKAVFRLERTDAAPVEQTELEPVVSQALTAANLSLDFSKITRQSTVAELRDYLEELLENMDAPTPNDPAKSELAAFLDSAAATLVTQTVPGKKNHLTLDGKKVADLADSAREVYTGLLAPLENNGVTLNKTLTPTVRALWEDVDLSKPCQIELDREAARALEDCDLQLLLGDARTYLRLAAQDLTTLARDLGGSLRVQFSQEEEGVYAIRFLNKEGEVVDQLSCPVTVSLPAGSALDTIMVSYAGGSDNWGGQYDPAAGAISFDARYSGQYEVLENNVAINDIGALSEESRAAISFMVSKGYLGADNGAFRPGEPLTRYEFTEALVGMFFALDRELTTDFPDVEPTSRYYPYVASAQAKSIVNGYDNGTFSGDDPINREQVFALAARTLMEQKGYAQPADSEVYLSSFNDRSELSPWAAPQVALAVREGIAGRGAVLLPKANITREQAAVVLYRLFQLLYEVSPVSLELPGGGGGFPLPAVIGIGAGALAIGGVAVAVILLRKKKQTPVG